MMAPAAVGCKRLLGSAPGPAIGSSPWQTLRVLGRCKFHLASIVATSWQLEPASAECWGQQYGWRGGIYGANCDVNPTRSTCAQLERSTPRVPQTDNARRRSHYQLLRTLSTRRAGRIASDLIALVDDSDAHLRRQPLDRADRRRARRGQH